MANAKEIEGFYDGYLVEKSYPYEDYRHENIDRFILSHVGKKDRVLDVGCGYGRILRKLKNREIYGCDISAKALKKAPERARKKQVNLEGRLPYKNGFFDCVILREVIEHIVNRKGLFSEIGRVLKKNGKLILTTPNKYSTVFPVYSVIRIFAMQPVEAWPTRKEIECLADNAGFKVVRFESEHFFPWHSYLPDFFLPAVKKIDSFAKNAPGTRNMLFLAVKK
ncbi:MAG: class I SAM-dependent methyltransferase [Candidatus ainarchaeum sp.]|nr:class I SAM-dependent methyltransferase [Candidatus ainarchaeum sp.]